MARGRYGNRVSPRFAGAKPARQWVSINTGWAYAAQAVSSQVSIMQMQGPTNVTSLTSDPPEDITILRVRGEFSVELSADTAAASWSLALTVQDTNWTQDTFVADSDKRILWARTYEAGTTNAVHTWRPPGYLEIASTAFVEQAEMTSIDIAPKVRLEPGKSLALVAYENAGARTLTVVARTMRLLYQKSRRR